MRRITPFDAAEAVALPQQLRYPQATTFRDVEGPLAQHQVDYAAADGNDYAEHENTYRFFVTLVKWSVFALAALLVLMAIFLT